MSSDLQSETVQSHLTTQWLGRDLRCFDELGSTNSEAAALAQAGASHGTVVVADRQSAGRGRRQRTWHSPGGENLYLSALLRPQWKASDPRPVSLAAGVGLAEALAPRLPTPPLLKWPNDVLAGGKKLAGILVEGAMQAEHVEWVIVGIGVNVNTAEFPAELATIAESLGRLVGRELDRGEVLAAALNSLEPWFDTLAEQGPEPIVAAWLTRAAHLGQRVRIDDAPRTHEGVMQGVAADGALLLCDDEGRELRVVSGDMWPQQTTSRSLSP